MFQQKMFFFKTAYQLGPFCLFINRLDVSCVVPAKEPETFFSFNSMCLCICAHTQDDAE